MKNTPATRVRFGGFELDLKSGELRSTDTAESTNVLLREQAFQVLRMLLERQGKIVTREEIKSRLWANDTVVDFDHSINATINTLRRALGDSADHSRYIETLARRGYRLLPIQHLESAPETALAKERESEQPAVEIGENTAGVERQMKPHGWKAAVVLAAVVILVGAGYFSWRRFRPTPPSPGKNMLAVLPFENLTGDPNKEYLADGLTEETISRLGRLNPEQLGVIARTSVMGYKHKVERLDEIGRDLSVQYVLESSLRGSKDHMRITAQLIQVKDQTHLWSQDYDYRAQDILSVQDDVAQAVAQQIQLRLTSQQQADLARPRQVNPEAFDAYLQGYHFFQRRTAKDVDMAARYYERATQLDPSYALAWVGLSRARYWQANAGGVPIGEGQRLAREAVERALLLNPNLAAAHAQMGRLKRQVDFDWVGANASIQRAIALEPGNPEYLRAEAASTAYLGRFDQALQLGRRAVELDPLNADSWENFGEIEFFNGQLDKAVTDCKKALELSPDVSPGHFYMIQAYIMQGRPQDAWPEIERVRSDSLRRVLYAMAYHSLGRQKESDAALMELIANYHAIEANGIAEVYAFRNQPDEAFEWLDRAYAQRDGGLTVTKVDPLFKSLHSDPRYTAFIKKLNLPD
jgi:TolB-like protein/DNA-binding winged helix-turn-helix (wHTH) protein